MELNEEYFNKLRDRKNNAIKNIVFMHTLWQEYSEIDKNISYTIRKRAERMENCLSYWKWDIYRKNKVMDLKQVFRCKDMFCPNCRRVAVYKAIINFSHHFKRLLDIGYHPYLVTLTVPNIEATSLSDEIDKMNNAFSIFWRWLYKPFSKNGSYYGGYKDRIFDAVGAVKVIEVTVQKNNWNMFHPHFHVLMFLENDFENYFIKDIPGGYQYKTKKYIFYSEADIFIQKLWKMAYDRISISRYKDVSSEWQDNYICDIRELVMPGGLYEVFKYYFKDIDIKNYDVFKNLFWGLKRKRLRQGYGELYNVKLDDMDYPSESIKDYLDFKDEEPQEIASSCIEDMTRKYRKYKKVSIYKNKNR
jgi:plasmid rolling circle replication initiator protein Rep